MKHLRCWNVAVTAVAGLLVTLIAINLSANQPVRLEIGTQGEHFAYDKTRLSVRPNQVIRLTFKNGSSMPHNWVLVNPGSVDRIAADSIRAGATKDWLADSPDILAHTKMLNPRQEETIEFTAPSTPGEYPYFCSFPGHAQLMRGVLVVR